MMIKLPLEAFLFDWDGVGGDTGVRIGYENI